MQTGVGWQDRFLVLTTVSAEGVVAFDSGGTSGVPVEVLG